MDEIRMTTEAGGCRFGLRVVPNASKDEVSGPFGDRLRVRVRAVPDKGKANAAVIIRLAGALGIAPVRVEIVAGHGSRDKTVLVRGLDPDSVRSLLSGP
jgi:uncharacterized protein (TIGR00251 family)